MKDGVVHQCASPLEVYQRPVNRFVGSFVGSPPMSFLHGRIVGRDGSLWFDEGTTLIPLGGRLAELLSGHEDRPMVMGIRPDAFSVEPPPSLVSTSMSALPRLLNLSLTLPSAFLTSGSLNITSAVLAPMTSAPEVWVSLTDANLMCVPV